MNDNSIVRAVIHKIGVMKMMFANHEPTVTEILDRQWVNTCEVLIKRIEQLEAKVAELENVIEVAVKRETESSEHYRKLFKGWHTRAIDAEAVIADVRKLVDTMPTTSNEAQAIVYRVNAILKRGE